MNRHLRAPADGRADQFFRFGVVVTGIALLVGPVVQSLKLLDLLRGVAAGFFYIKLIATAFAFVASYLLLLKQHRLTIGLLDLLLALLVVWGGVFTLFFGGTVVDIVGNLLRLALVVTCYQVARQYAHTVDISHAIRIFGITGFVGVVVALGVVYFWGVLGGRSLYLGLSTQGLFVALAYILARERNFDWLWVALLMLLIVAGGKRGNMLAAMAMILAAVLFVRRMSGRKTVGMTVLAACGVFLLVGVDYALIAGGLPEPLAQRFLVWTPEMGSEINLAEATANRVTEVRSVVAMWQETPVAMVSGFGLGAVIPKNPGITVSTVHMSPVALALQYGIPLALVVLIAIYIVPIRKLLRARRSLGVKERTWCLTALGLLVLSTSVMELFQDPVLWIALGCLSGSQPAQRVPGEHGVAP